MTTTPQDVDRYLTATVVGEDPALAEGKARAVEAGLPQIEVTAGQGKLLHLIARIHGARRILEIGTLGGYSTTWLARALPEDGALITCEFEPRHAEVARANLDAAGVGDRVEIRLGAARETLAALAAEGAEPFDLVFIDADKVNNPHYIEGALALSRPGTVLVLDNVVRGGSVVVPGDPDTEDGRATNGTRTALELLGDDPRVDATAVQTTGSKGWDGFALAIVR
ncbi:O-methyltransferase [Zafaria sp. Z1313]|uniref:O-methyltransferase n=1 Tax=unclassified Zafaria TaxID=2828765 RepID=UPI002E7936CE|nr:O-methyltransferase [Zafaria sp. J156]MEE1622125.1 O-methyltransferase [Zafaria sp. J156]